MEQPTAPETPTEDAPAEEGAPEEPPAISDEAWDAMLEKQVEVDVGPDTTHKGKLAAVTDDTAVLVDDAGQVQTLRKADATGLRLAEKPVEAKATEPEADKKKEEPKDWAKLGLFMTHGVSYSHWRTQTYRQGAAAYALDIGAGYNFKDTIGLYGVFGGNVASRLKLSDGGVRGNMGHFSAMVRFKKKYFAIMGGLGIGWSRLDERGIEGSQTVKDRGLAVPIKIMGHIPLPKHFYLGIGVGYTLAVFGKGRLFNAPSLQLVLARW